MVEEQTTQLPKEKGHKDKLNNDLQNIHNTNHTKNRANNSLVYTLFHIDASYVVYNGVRYLPPP